MPREGPKYPPTSYMICIYEEYTTGTSCVICNFRYEHTSIRTKVIIQRRSPKCRIPCCSWNISIVCTISTLWHSTWIPHLVVLHWTESKYYFRHNMVRASTIISIRKQNDPNNPTAGSYPWSSPVNNYSRTAKFMRLCHYRIHCICSSKENIESTLLTSIQKHRWKELIRINNSEDLW